MFELLFNAAVTIMVVIISIMPFLATGATIYLGSVYFSDQERPRNKILRAIFIDSLLVTAGSAWWALVALRRVFVGNAAPALPEWTLLLYGLSLIFLMIVPLHKFVIMRSIQKDEEDRLANERERNRKDLTDRI